MKFLEVIFLILLLSGCNDRPISKLLGHEMASDSPEYSLISKRPEPLSAQAYLQYAKNTSNGLYASRRFGDVHYVLMYQPHELLAIRHSMFLSLNDTTLFYRELDELGSLQYFLFNISIDGFNQELLKFGVKSIQEYEERVTYFSFGMQKDFRLIEGKDTLECMLFHYERNYGISPRASFVLAFERPENDKKIFDKILMYEDRVFGTGRVYISISKEGLAQIPQLNMR